MHQLYMSQVNCHWPSSVIINLKVGTMYLITDFALKFLSYQFPLRAHDATVLTVAGVTFCLFL
jgi:hypothetical protein